MVRLCVEHPFTRLGPSACPFAECLSGPLPVSSVNRLSPWCGVLYMFWRASLCLRHRWETHIPIGFTLFTCLCFPWLEDTFYWPAAGVAAARTPPRGASETSQPASSPGTHWAASPAEACIRIEFISVDGASLFPWMVPARHCTALPPPFVQELFVPHCMSMLSVTCQSAVGTWVCFWARCPVPWPRCLSCRLVSGAVAPPTWFPFLRPAGAVRGRPWSHTNF